MSRFVSDWAYRLTQFSLIRKPLGIEVKPLNHYRLI